MILRQPRAAQARQYLGRSRPAKRLRAPCPKSRCISAPAGAACQTSPPPDSSLSYSFGKQPRGVPPSTRRALLTRYHRAARSIAGICTRCWAQRSLTKHAPLPARRTGIPQKRMRRALRAKACGCQRIAPRGVPPSARRNAHTWPISARSPASAPFGISASSK